MALTTFAAMTWQARATGRHARSKADTCGASASDVRQGFVEMFVRSGRVGARIFGRNVGYAFFIAWSLAISFDPVLLGGLDATAWLSTPALVGLGTACGGVVLGLLGGRMSDLARRRGPLAVIAAIAVAGIILLGAAGVGYGGGRWGAMGATLSGLSLALLVSAWLERFMRQGLDSVVWNYLLGTVCGSMIYGAISLVPPPARIALVAALPVVSAVLAGSARGLAVSVAGSASRRASTEGRTRARAGGAIPRMLLAVAIVFLTSSMVRQQSVLLGMPALLGGSLLLTLLLQVLACVIAKVLATYSYAFHTSVIFYVAVPALAVSSLLLLATYAGPVGTVLSGSCAYVLAVLSAQLLSFLVVFRITEELRAGCAEALPTIGWLNAVEGAAPVAGCAVVGALSNEYVTVLLALICLIAVLLVVLGGVDDFSLSSVRSPEDEAERHRRRIQALARRYGLTPRECDVLELWGQGHTSAYIQDALSITKNTVKTHTAHIYAKTGTGNKEELLQLVEEFTSDDLAG